MWNLKHKDNTKYSLVSRTYSKDNNSYPQLRISIYVDCFDVDSGYVIECSYKSDEAAWWCKGGIPLDLFDDLKVMLDEVKNNE